MDDPLPLLSASEVRVLGALIEKHITTPDYYPLSLNALTNACNQQNNRDPIVAYDDQTVVRALDGLRAKRLATLYNAAEGRVAKYKHALTDVIPLTHAETALLCVLLLRGPQTLAELRTRTERMFPFDNPEEVQEVLTALATREPPLVVKLPLRAGAKEPRHAHLLSGPVDVSVPEKAVPVEPATAAVRAEDERLAQLEAQIAELRQEMAKLQQAFSDFRRQFE